MRRIWSHKAACQIFSLVVIYVKGSHMTREIAMPCSLELKEVVSRGLPRASGFTVRREADRGRVFNNMPLNRRAAEGTHTRSPSKDVSSTSALSWIWKE